MLKTVIFKPQKQYSFFQIVCSALIAIMMTSIAVADTTYRVRSADSLNSIVKKFYPDRTLTKAQIMVGILNTNPQAFNSGNINKLIRGKKLFLPDEVYFTTVSSVEASEILAKHARGLRENKIISNITASNNDNNSNTNEEITKTKKEQSQKISKLEKDSEALRKQLETLVNEKGVRDKKLAELEVAIKKSLEVPRQTGSEKENAIAAQKLKEKNEILERELHKSRSELAENTRSTISLERRLNDLENKGKQVNANKAAIKAKGVAENDKAVKDSIPSSMSDNGFSSKLIWLIPVLLLAGFWYLFNWLKGSKRKETISYDDDLGEISEYESNDIDLDYKEVSMETSIKLDVARAYLEAGSTESALDILKEVMEEGNGDQRLEAQDILSAIESA